MFYLIGTAAILVAIMLTAALFRQVVPTDKVHIVQSKKKTTAYGCKLAAGNVYYSFPSWIPVIGVTVRSLPVSNFTISLTGYEAYDQGKVPFNVDVKAFFRVANPETAAQRIEDFPALRDQLEDILKGAIRSILAGADIIDIMEKRSEFGEKFSLEVGGQLTEWGVESVKSIELMDIRDAHETEVISNIMEKKKSLIEKESRIVVAENLKNAQIKEIETKRESDVKTQEAEKLVGEKTAEKTRIVGIADEKANQDIEEQKKETMTKKMAVLEVEHTRTADINKAVQIVNSNKEAEKVKIEALGSKEATVTLAEGDKEAQIKKADGEYAIGSKQAAVVKEKAEAEVSGKIKLADAISKLKEYMEYLVSIKSVEAGQAVGTAQAGALKDADLKLISTGGNSGKDVNGLLGMLNPEGAAKIGAMMDAFEKTTGIKINKPTKKKRNIKDVQVLEKTD